MQRLKAFTAGVIVSVLVTLMLSISGAGASNTSGKATAEFNETEIRHAVGHESETWRTRVYTRQGKFAGSGVIACVPTSTADSLQECTGVYILPRGSVAVQGGITSRGGFVLIVVGGTDAYLGVRGLAVVKETQKTPRHARLTFFFK